MSISIIVFWQDQHVNPQGRSFSSAFEADPMGAALVLMEEKRREGMRHVCMSVENSDSVGKPGVDSVVDGKTPDGHTYDWKKRRP